MWIKMGITFPKDGVIVEIEHLESGLVWGGGTDDATGEDTAPLHAKMSLVRSIWFPSAPVTKAHQAWVRKTVLVQSFHG